MRPNIVKTVTITLLLAAFGASGCSLFGGGAPAATDTPSSADVLQTAQAIAQATRGGL